MTNNHAHYDNLLRLRKQKPFQPFAISTKDGLKHLVTEFARMVTNGREVLVIGRHDAISEFKLADISSIEETASAKGQ